MTYRTALLALSLPLCGACQNNTVTLHFDTDPDGTSGGGNVSITATMGDGVDDGVDDGDTGTRPMPGIAGNWLLAASTPLDPNLPFQFFVVAEEIGPGNFNLTMTSLSLDLGSTTSPRQLVGEPKIFFGVPLTPDTGFEIFTGPLLIPGAANPITGSEVSVDILLSGTPAGNPYCGTISGSVTSPAPTDLGGSTFGTEKVNDIASLPPTFATSC